MGDGLDRLGEGDVDEMHAFRAEDVDGSSERCRYRWHEDREAAIVEFLNDEGRDERLLDLGQHRLPHLLFTLPYQLLCQAPKQSVAGNSAKE